MGVPLPDSVRAEFPIATRATYLNHAASAPLPARSAAALRRYVDDRQQLYHLYQSGTQDYDSAPLRGKLGRLLNVAPNRIGFVPTTTDGIGSVLNGLPWQPGDNVVVPANEFPGVMYGCLHLARLGVEVRQVPPRLGHLDLDDIHRAFDRRTRAAVISHVHWQTGHRLDLRRFAEACAANGTLSVVDAIQSVGAVAVDLAAEPVDVLVAGTYKWLLGTHGLAVMAVSDRALAAGTPDRAGWASMATSVHSAPRLEWAPDARRYAVGGAADGALIALEPSVDLLLEVGVATVERHNAMLVGRLFTGLPDVGLSLSTRADGPLSPAFISATTGDPRRDEALVERLVAQRIIVARRGPGIRISPHLHNSTADIDRLLDACREVVALAR